MLKRGLLVTAALALLATPAEAWPRRGVVTVAALGPCPQLVDNGCAAAVAAGGLIMIPLASMRQSGQTWTSAHPPNYNIPGALEDGFGVGPNILLAAALDPNTLMSGPCQFTASTSTPGGTGPAVVCQSSSANVTIDKINFTPSNQEGHCVPIIIRTSFTGYVLVTNSFWDNDPNCAGSTGQGYFAVVSNPGSATIESDNNSFLGEWNSFKTGMQGAVWANTSGSFIFKRNYVERMPSRAFSHSTAVATEDVEGNLIIGCQNEPYQGHCEENGWGNSGTVPSSTINGNTIVLTSDGCNCATSPIYTSAGTGTGVYTAFNIQNNFIVTNRPGGGAVSSGTFSYTIDNGSGTGPGAVLTVTSLNGITALAHGMSLLDGSNGLWIDTSVGGGTGVGSQWTVVCATASTNPCTGSSVNPSIQISGSGTLLAQTTGPALTETSVNTFGQITISGNYVDMTGGTGFAATPSTGTQSTCSNPTIFGGVNGSALPANVSLTDGSTITGWSPNNSNGC